MCGLVTLISKRGWGFNGKDVKVFEEMLTVDQLRGQDATGAFCVHRNQQVAGVKGAFTPWHLFQTKEWEEFARKADSTGRILVGHNRHGTHGNNKDSKNAHPFREDNIILVHNGTLWNHRKLAQRDVDSHAVAAAFAEGDYTKVLTEVDGAYVFIWYDMQRKQLSIVRNKERPLYKFENDDLILFCSESWMGSGVLRRNGFSVFMGSDEKERKASQFKVEEVPVDVVAHYEVGGKLISTEAVVKKAPVSVTITRVNGTNTTHTGTTNAGQGNVQSITPTNTRGLMLARRVLADRVAAARAKERSSQGGAVIPFRSDPWHGGREILVQINEVRVDNANAAEKDQRFRVTGTTVEPGLPIIDFVGTLPDYLTHDSVGIWKSQPVRAKILVYRETVNGGPCITVGNFHMDAMVQVHPRGFITATEWKYVTDKCKCKRCEKAIGEFDARFTSIKRDYKNSASVEMEVICGDCIEEKITDQEVKSKFKEDRLATLEKWEQELRLAGETVKRAIALPGNSTTH